MTSKKNNKLPTDAESLRSKAERELQQKLSQTGIPELDYDVKKLLHELQVHQIELEMQNEELRKANEITETSLRKYSMLYNFAPMAYFTLKPDGTILDLNIAGTELMSVSKVSPVNVNFKLYVSDESKPVFSQFLQNVFSSTSKETCEVKLEYNKITLGYAYMEAIAIQDEQICFMSVVDMSNTINLSDFYSG